MNTYTLIKRGEETLKKVKRIIRAINHPVRLEILRVMQEKGKASVTELYIALRMEQSVASQHLAILRKAGIVKKERDGKFNNYFLDEGQVAEIMEVFEKL
jgi:DNA-binding transcriptional ArsR family regulator